MIVVTGANGKLGNRIVGELTRLMLPTGIGVSVRDPDQASEFAKQGIRVRLGNYDDRRSLLHSFEGATQILLVSSNAAATGGDPVPQHRTVISAAAEAGVRRIVYTSHMGANYDSLFPPMQTHAETEEMLALSGLAWTSLRNGFYASTVPQLIGMAKDTGVLEAPADGPVSWTSHADLALAAAIVLRDEGRFEGPTPPLTTSVALNLSDVAELLATQWKRSVLRKVISDKEQEQKLTQRGVPSHGVAIALGLYRAARAGEFRSVNNTLTMLIGREPLTLAEYLRSAMAS